MSGNFKTNQKKLPLVEFSDTTGELNFFDLANPDINLFNLVDEEMIRISGSPLLYYPYIPSQSNYDPVYMEERNKPISTEPIEIYGHYEPKVVEEVLSQFGIELTNDQLFVFNKSYIDQKIVGGIKVGSVIKPKFQNMKFEIFEVQEESFEIYGVYHLVCSGKLLRDSSDVQDTPLHNISETVARPQRPKKRIEDIYGEE